MMLILRSYELILNSMNLKSEFVIDNIMKFY